MACGWELQAHPIQNCGSYWSVFIDASDNNRAKTVEKLFLQATASNGYPINVRTDHGGEDFWFGGT